jgi:hypothetical protein
MADLEARIAALPPDERIALEQYRAEIRAALSQLTPGERDALWCQMLEEEGVDVAALDQKIADQRQAMRACRP